MKQPVRVEIIGFTKSSCGPFPCDEDRTCGLEECHPSGEFRAACSALRTALHREFGDQVVLIVTPLDDGVPDHVKEIIEKYHPPLPIVRVNGRFIPLGRISLAHLRSYITNADR